MISNTALCGLGKTAAFPVLGTIRYFRDEYEAHIRESAARRAVPEAQTHLDRGGRVQGCSKCARNCPVNAITGKVKEPFTIDANKCIKCGACVEACPFHAVKEG